MKFDLTHYVEDIREMSKTSGTSLEEAVENFVVNLIVMHEHYPGAPQLNFHQLGQQWNSLPSKQKLLQKKQVTEMLTATPAIRTRKSKEVRDG